MNRIKRWTDSSQALAVCTLPVVGGEVLSQVGVFKILIAIHVLILHAPRIGLWRITTGWLSSPTFIGSMKKRFIYFMNNTVAPPTSSHSLSRGKISPRRFGLWMIWSFSGPRTVVTRSRPRFLPSWCRRKRPTCPPGSRGCPRTHLCPFSNP